MAKRFLAESESLHLEKNCEAFTVEGKMSVEGRMSKVFFIYLALLHPTEPSQY